LCYVNSFVTVARVMALCNGDLQENSAGCCDSFLVVGGYV
jgi:hypothetical protein